MTELSTYMRGFKTYMAKNATSLQPYSSDRNWLEFAIPGQTVCHINVYHDFIKKQIGVALMIYQPEPSPIFERLAQNKIEIENKIGDEKRKRLEWQPSNAVANPYACILVVRGIEKDEISNPDMWTAHYEWLMTYLDRFIKVFSEELA